MSDAFVEKAKVWDSDPGVIALVDKFTAELNKIVSDASGLSILEFGCGTGLVGLRYADKAASLYMVDNSPAMLAVLRAKEATKADHVSIYEGGLSQLIEDTTKLGTVDWVVSNMALHHVDDIPALIRGLHTLIKPGGRVTIGELLPETGTFHAPDVVPHDGFDPRELAELFERGGFTDAKYHEYLTMPKGDSDGVTRDYGVFILDAVSLP